MFLRALVVLLLILNLGVATWTLFRPAPAEESWSAGTAGVSTLRLVSEPARPGAPEAAPAAEAAATVVDAVQRAPSGALRCFSVGPFADEDAALAAAARLRPSVRGVDMRRVVQASAWSISLPAQPSRAAAEALAARIREAGFKDLFVVPSGEDANSIALGRYGNGAAARQHASRLQAAGFPARVRAAGEISNEFWVDVAAAPSVDADALSQAGASQVEPADCPRGPA